MIFENVKRILEEKGIQVVDFENAMGMSRGGFYKWRNHSPSVQTVKKASEILEVPVSEILD